MDFAGFWGAFEKVDAELSLAMHQGRESEVFDALCSLLDLCGIDWCFDITIDGPDCCLIFSPEGDPEVAENIDALLASAPRIFDWKFFGRRQKKPLSDAASIVRNLYLIDPLAMSFRVQRIEDTHMVEMTVPDSVSLTPEEAQGLINMFLWHALGEGFVMDRKIRGVVTIGGESSSSDIDATELLRVVGR